MASHRDTPASKIALRAVSYCRAAIGTPYVWGGITPNGYDCSGLCYAAYAAAGHSIPRTSEEQWAAGFMDVPWGSWAAGDLVFSQWPGDGQSPGHVVIYAGGGSTIAAPHTGTTVQWEPVSTFAAPAYVGSKRPVPLKGAQAYSQLGQTVTGTQPAGPAAAGGSATGGLVAGLGLLPLLLIGVGVLVIGGILLFKQRPQEAPAPEGTAR